jgi:hypothetical protein
MAASAWQLYNSGKRYIGNGTITLGAGSFKMALLNSASNTSTFTLSTFASLTGQISATGGYVSGGKELVPATGQWTVGASATADEVHLLNRGLDLYSFGFGTDKRKIRCVDLWCVGSCSVCTETLCVSASFPQVNLR